MIVVCLLLCQIIELVISTSLITNHQIFSNHSCPLEEMEPCGCSKAENVSCVDTSKILPSNINNNSHGRRRIEVRCCKNMIKGFPRNGTNVAVNWTIIPNEAPFRVDPDCSFRLLSTGLRRKDVGANFIFTCHISVMSDGEQKMFNLSRNFTIKEIPGKDIPNVNLKISNFTNVAVAEQNVSITCSTDIICDDYSTDNYKFRWTQVVKKGDLESEKEIVNNSIIQITTNLKSLSSTVRISTIEYSHLGKYRCHLIYHQKSLNLTSMAETQLLLDDLYPVVLSIVSVVFVICLSISCICLLVYFKDWIHLYYRSHYKINRAYRYKYDYFVIHGYDSADWVREVLRNRLWKYQYNGMVPDINLVGGEVYSTAIQELIKNSHLVILVESDDLQSLPIWGGKAVYQAIINTKANLLRINLEYRRTTLNKDHYDYRRMTAVKMIKWPQTLESHFWNEIFERLPHKTG